MDKIEKVPQTGKSRKASKCEQTTNEATRSCQLVWCSDALLTHAHPFRIDLAKSAQETKKHKKVRLNGRS